MIKKLPMIVLMTIITYSIIPIIVLMGSIGVSGYLETILDKLFIFLPVMTYILSFLDLYFICKQNKYYDIIKLALIVKILYIPVIFSLILFGMLTLLVIIGTGIIALGLILGILILLLTSIYSSTGIYLYYKNNNIKCRKTLLLLQWLFPLDIIILIILLIKIKKDKLIKSR